MTSETKVPMPDADIPSCNNGYISSPAFFCEHKLNAYGEDRASERDAFWMAKVGELERKAARYDWLRARFLGADFDWNENGIAVLLFKVERDTKVWGDCDLTIDDALSSAED